MFFSINSFHNGFTYRYDIDRFDVESLISFSSGGWYKNIKAEKTPKELTAFDSLLDHITKELKVLELN